MRLQSRWVEEGSDVLKERILATRLGRSTFEGVRFLAGTSNFPDLGTLMILLLSICALR
jgi:hypothetical protein